MMAIDDLVNKGKDFLEANKDKIDEALHSEQAEQVSDSALHAAAKFAKTLAPEGQQGTVDDVRANIDKSIGNE